MANEVRVKQASLLVAEEGTQGEVRVKQASLLVAEEGTQGEVRVKQASLLVAESIDSYNPTVYGLGVTLGALDPESPGSQRTLYLVHMEEDNGTRTLTEQEYFPSEYRDNRPIARIRVSWTVNDAKEDSTGYFLGTTDYETIADGDYQYGTEETVTDPFSIYGAGFAANDYVTPAQEEKMTYHHMQNCRLAIPMSESLVTPGEKITFTNNNLEQPISGYIHARTIIFDYNNFRYIVEGEGVFTA